MGVDIAGRVEYRNSALDHNTNEKIWYSVIDVGFILDRSYTMFGSLFGVRNSTSFAPVAANRGLPEDISGQIKEEAEQEGNHSYTWISWDELAAIDWDELGVYAGKAISRRDALGDSGHLMLELMKPLADRYGGQCVRLIVWFDNYS